MNMNYCAPMVVCYDNDNDAYIPERWAMQSLAILEANQVMARLVNRDFQDEISQFGDVVNTRRPGTRKGNRRNDGDTYVSTAASSTNVQVPLDQWFYDSFVINDGEQSKSFKDLVQVYIEPAVQNIARQVDRAVLGQVHRFIKTPSARCGRLSNLNASTGLDFITEADMLMNQQNAHMAGRNLVLSARAKAGMLRVPEFTRVDAIPADAQNVSALRTAQLGEILGFNTFMSQNTPYVDVAGADVVTGTITNLKAANTGGTQACTISNYEVVNGEYAVVAGNDQPTYITDNTASTNTTAITLNEDNKYGTSATAPVTVYKACAANATYAPGHAKRIVLKSHTAGKNPTTGQLLSFGTSTRHTYTIIEHEVLTSTTTSVLLDRPLEVQVAEDDDAFPGPAGSFNLAFHRDALALVSRPLALPMSGGVNAGSATYNDVSMRVIMQYDSTVGGTRVNFDILAGVALLDTNLATLVLG